MCRHWSWRFFEAEVPLTDSDKAKLAQGQEVKVKICSKAIDGDFNSQPERMRSVWNVLGICANHYSCIQVKVCVRMPCTSQGCVCMPWCSVWLMNVRGVCANHNSCIQVKVCECMRSVWNVLGIRANHYTCIQVRYHSMCAYAQCVICAQLGYVIITILVQKSRYVCVYLQCVKCAWVIVCASQYSCIQAWVKVCVMICAYYYHYSMRMYVHALIHACTHALIHTYMKYWDCLSYTAYPGIHLYIIVHRYSKFHACTLIIGSEAVKVSSQCRDT